MKMKTFLLFFCGLFIGYQSIAQTEVAILADSSGYNVLQYGKTRIVMDPEVGARIVSLRFNNNELLTGKEIEPDYYGSSLWLSPFSDFWPQSGVLDKYSYEVRKIENGYSYMSQLDTLNNLQYGKAVRYDPECAGLELEYVIKNFSDSIKKLSSWEVTRLYKDGISFFPINPNSGEKIVHLAKSIESKLKDHILWHSYDPEDILKKGERPKLFADGKEGWIAYVRDNILFVKSYQDVEFANFAPGEQEIEIYVNPDLPYIEIEIQSPYTFLMPGESLIWNVHWHLEKLPEGSDYKMGEKMLVHKVRELID